MHEYGTFGNKIKILARVNSAFAVAKHCFAVVKQGFAAANPRVALFGHFSLPRRSSLRCCEGLCHGERALHYSEGPILVFPPSRFFFKNPPKTKTKTWDSLPKTSKYHPKPTMSKTHGWIRVFLSQNSFREI